MGRVLSLVWAPARRLWEAAESLSGLPLRELSWQGPEVELRRPRALEPALAVVSLAHAERLLARSGPPACVAGYSAGDLPALVCAGVLASEAALQIAVVRGRILEEAAGAVASRMVALSRLPAAAAAHLVAQTAQPSQIGVAGWNAPDHVTISGRADLVRALEGRALRLGAEVAEVAVQGPWHCPFAEGAARAVKAALHGVYFLAPQRPVFASASGERVDDPLQLRELLAEQICRPVLWHRTVTQLVDSGVHEFVEVGPGRVLSGFVRRTVGAAAHLCIRAVERPGGALVPSAAPLHADGSQQPGIAHGVET
jgi:[acyl-carrier-protein] S-malonyltransferase